jgi:hypothetical protein
MPVMRECRRSAPLRPFMILVVQDRRATMPDL